MIEKFQLSEEQTNALQRIQQFISSGKDPAFLLSGYAGTGKTVCIGELITWCEKVGINYCLCAPTHKAALVMQRYTDRESITLHKLLSLSPNLDIFELDFNNLLFKVGNSRLNIPYNGLVICDESSMINDDLYKLLLQKCSENKAKLLFVMDDAQLAPVKQDYKSLVTKTEPCAALTTIFRQSSGNKLNSILWKLRHSPISKFHEEIGDEGSIYVTEDPNTFVAKSIVQLRRAVKKGDILDCKVAAFTNARVDYYNSKIHQFIAGEGVEYAKYEFLTGCENVEFNGFKFFNSMDYIITSEPTRTDLFIPTVGTLPGWRFELYDTLDKHSENVSILDKGISKDYLEKLACKIEECRLEAVDSKRSSRYKSSKMWKLYYEIMGSFTSPVNLYYDGRLVRKKSFDYGYACTVHRLQGSSYNNILVDMRNIGSCPNDEFRRQLQYVALSRTRKDALLFQ